MNFDMSATTGVKESGKFLAPGIHKAKFNGLMLDTITSQKDSSTYKVMQLNLDVDGYGEYSRISLNQRVLKELSLSLEKIHLLLSIL